MRMRFVAAALAIGMTTPALAEERWCLDNPADCYCSVPLNNNDTLPVSSSNYQFSDATPGCSRFDFGTNAYPPVMVMPTGLPAGVDYVMHDPAAHSAMKLHADLGNVSADTRTIAYRFYMRLSQNHPEVTAPDNPPGACQRLKLAEFATERSAAGELIQYSINSGNTGPSIGMGLTCLGNAIPPSRYAWPQAKQELDVDFANGGQNGRWVRFEAAFDITGLSGVQTVQCRGRMTELEFDGTYLVPTGKVDELRSPDYVFDITGFNASTAGDNWIGNLYTQGDCNGPNNDQFRQYSHEMVATFDADTDRFIGPAYEMEGGAGSTPRLLAPAAPRMITQPAGQ